MAIIPAGHRLLVRQELYHEHDPVFRSARQTGLEIATDPNTRYQASVDKGEVVAVGPTAWKDFGGEPWAKKGDMVIFAKHSGKLVTDPNEEHLPEVARTPYILLNDEDVVAVVTKE